MAVDRNKFYQVIKQIPKGKVATYGQIAKLAGYPRLARQVGYALAASKEKIPWHRVVNAKGEISNRAKHEGADLQRLLLEDEGIEFDLKGRVPMLTYQWRL